METISTNKKARFDYNIIETYETGIVLTGDEVKACRNHLANIGNGYCMVNGNALTLIGSNIPFADGKADRDRTLLMHKKEIMKLALAIQQKGFTIIPIEMYFKGSLIKVKIGLCKGKNTIDKRETIKNRENDRNIRRLMKN